MTYFAIQSNRMMIQTAESVDNLIEDLTLIKIAMYMRVVALKRHNAEDFVKDPTAVRAYENLKKQLPEVLFYLSSEELNIVLDRYKGDLIYFKNNP